MNYKLNEIFEVYDTDNEKVILKVKADSPLKVAMFPFVTMEYAYITVTRGKNHILTVVKNDGRTFSFEWGMSGYTLIGDSLELLKQCVVRFTEENGILIECSGTPRKADVFYNSNYHKWQLSIRTDKEFACYWSRTAESLGEMLREVERLFVKSDTWEHEIAPTGISVWRADPPTFIYK